MQKINSQRWKYHGKASLSDGKGNYFSTWRAKEQEHHNSFFIKNEIKLKDNHNNENRSIHSNNDVKITQSEKNNTRTTRPIETEPLEIIVNDSNTRFQKSNQLYTGDKSSNLNDAETS